MMHHYGSILLPHGGSALVDMTYYENAVHAMWLASQEACDKLPSGVCTTSPTASIAHCAASCRS